MYANPRLKPRSVSMFRSAGILALGLISTCHALTFKEPGHEIVASASVSYNGHVNGGPVSAGTSLGGGGGGGASAGGINYNRPYFDDISPHNVTTIVDETAVLKCRVKNKGDRTVSPFLLHANITAGSRIYLSAQWWIAEEGKVVKCDAMPARRSATALRH